MSTSGKKSALFVCLGNICRSPIGEAVLQHLVNERGLGDQWEIDSCATADYHTGKSPDERAIDCMKKHNVPMNHKARKLRKDDFQKFQYIFGMDHENIKNINRMGPDAHTAKVELLGKYDPEGNLLVRDPYYDSGSKGFEEVYEQCLRCCKAFLDQVQE